MSEEFAKRFAEKVKANIEADKKLERKQVYTPDVTMLPKNRKKHRETRRIYSRLEFPFSIIRKVWSPTPCTTSLVITLPRMENLKAGDSFEISAESSDKLILNRVSTKGKRV